MIGQPTTEQILLDCCRELADVVMPAIGDDTVKVSVAMIDLVLRNAAVRAAHEIAWMNDEIPELEGYARDVLAALPNDAGVAEALDTSARARRGSLHLDDVVEAYRAASEAFSAAMEAAAAAGDDSLVDRARTLMERRVDREVEVMSGWSPVGR